MKLNHKTTLFIYLALVRSFLFAGDVSTANKADHTTVGQTYSTYNGTSTTEFDSVIPSSELNGISNSDYFENYNHQDVDRYNSHGNESNNLNTTIMSRDDETIYQFTNCGQTGRTGPSQSQTDNAYAGTSLDGAVTVSGGIQSWTVPTTGDYTIDSYGAQGGGPNGGLGAWMSGTFPLTAGQTIKVLVGQMGSYSAPMTTGGGGSFVATSTNAPMIVAGGGGAASQVGSGNQNGNTTITGGVAYGGWPDVGLQTYNAGTSGNGGDGSSGSGGGGGGGGFSTNGNDDDAFGYSFLNGGVGGSGGLSGGFGGGGGARNNGNNYWGGGAGGGYSGGAGACGTTTYDEVAGGGGSYNSGSDQINSVNNTGHGLVVITSYAASNTAPTATAQSVTGNEDSPQIITLAGTDAEGDALTYALATNPSNGTVSLNSGIAPINHSTADFVDPSGVNIQLSLSSTGWEGTSGWANAGIYVGPHVSVQPSGYNTPDGDGYFVRNYSGDSKSKYAITKADGNSTIQSADRGNIVFTADWAANTTLGARFVAIVDGTWYASGQFGMAANDHGNMNQTQVTDWEVDLSVNADTDNWYISLAGSPSGYEWRDGGQWSTTPISGGGLPAGNITQFGMAWLHTGNGNYGAVDNFRVINNDGGASAEVTYTPSTNYNGSDSFTFTVSDGVSTSSPATVDISITAVNDAPTISAQSASGNEDEAQEITLAGNDVDGDALTYVLATNSSNGASTLSGNVVTYTPNTNYNGSDSFTFTVSDAEYTSSAATVSITVASVNDLPVILSTPSLDALDGSLYEYSISVNDVDEDVVAITATGPNWLIVDNGTLSGTPSPSDGGLHQIVLSANDGNGGVVTQSYTLAVSLHSLVITGESGYRIFSSPVSGTIYGDLLDELWTQGAEGSDSPNSNPNIW
ncbi:MAG: tandem-95 repeat protein, partial [Candidatus Marinimicrobia bacterium]|nr:tandem-95 repeat protein [Candidatus Neomarinimicrobiota bacterium]